MSEHSGGSPRFSRATDRPSGAQHRARALIAALAATLGAAAAWIGARGRRRAAVHAGAAEARRMAWWREH